MGLAGSGITFSKMISMVLSGIEGLHCLYYIDDIVCYGTTFEEHNVSLEKVLERLRKHKLMVNPRKCTLLTKQCMFLGHKISSAGIEVDESKVEAIVKMPIPKNQREIKRILGCFNYFKKFIPGLATIARPINALLRKDVVFNFDEKCVKAYEELKKKLTSPPVLAHPDFEREFIIRTDASQFASGAVLSQGELGADSPIAFMSKAFNKHEVRYAIVEKELLAIIHAVRYFRPYIFLRKFLLVTDNKALIWIMNHKNPASRLMRWKIELLDYEFDIIHKPGASNKVADCLSRIDYSKDLKESMLEKDEIKNVNITTRSKTAKEVLHALDWEANQIETEIYDTKLMDVDILFLPPSVLKAANVWKVFVILDSIFYPYELIEKYDIRVVPPGEIIKLDNRSYAFWAQHNMKTNDYTSVWKRIKMDISADPTEKIFIFINYASFNILDSIRIALLKTFDKSNIEIHLVSNKIILIESEEEKQNIIKNFHENIMGGHLGIKATIEKIKQQYFWDGMGEQTRKFVSKCLDCKRNKINRHTRMEMCITETPQLPNEMIVMDCVGPIGESIDGARFITTFQCCLTCFVHAIPSADITAFTVAKIFVERLICLHGIPKIILTDMGSNFMSQMFEETMKLLNISHVHASVRRPESVGKIEKWHRYLGDFIRMFTDTNRAEWSAVLPYSVFVFNNKVHSTTRYTPHYLMYGFNTEIPSGLQAKPTPIYNMDDYVSVLQNRMRTAHDIARKNILKSKENNKKQYDKRSNPVNFNIGDEVLVLNELKNHKFAERYLGPYQIISMTNENCTLKINGANKTYHKNKLKPI